MADLICMRVATSTFGLARLCSLHSDLPDKDTINVWRYEHPEFSVQYAQAKLKQADLLAEEINDIADDGSNDWMESFGEEGDTAYRLNGEHVQRSRLRVDTRKWLASKLLPKQYGGDALLQQTKEENDELKEEIRALRAKLDEKNRKDY